MFSETLYKSSGRASCWHKRSQGYRSLFQVFKLGGRRKRYVSRKTAREVGYSSGSVRAKEQCSILLVLREIFVWPWKMVSLSICYLFYQSVDETIKTWTLRFPAKENDSIDQSCCSLTSKRSIDWFLESSWWSVRSSNRSISVRLLFYSRVFMATSTSYENRSNRALCKQANAGRFLTSNISLSPPANSRVSSVDCSCLFFSPVFSSFF